MYDDGHFTSTQPSTVNDESSLLLKPQAQHEYLSFSGTTSQLLQITQQLPPTGIVRLFTRWTLGLKSFLNNTRLQAPLSKCLVWLSSVGSNTLSYRSHHSFPYFVFAFFIMVALTSVAAFLSAEPTLTNQFSPLSPWVSNPAVPLPTWESPIHETVWHAVWGDRQQPLMPSGMDDTSRETTNPTFTMWFTTLFQRNTPKSNLSQESGRPASALSLSGTRFPKVNDSKGPKLVIAGMMKVGDRPCNIAQMSLKSGNWSLQELTQLSLYNSYSGGEVYYILANHSLSYNNTNGSRSLLSQERMNTTQWKRGSSLSTQRETMLSL